VVQGVQVVRDPVNLGLAVRVGPMDRAGLRLAVPVGLDLGRVAPADLPPVVRVGLVVDLTVPAARVGLDRTDLAAPAGPLVLDRMGRLVPVVPNTVGRVDLDRMDLAGPVVPNMVGRVGLDLVDLAGPVVPNMVGRVGLDLVGRVGLDRMDLVGRVVPAGLGLTGLVGLVGRVDPVDPVDPVVPVVLNMADPVGPVDRHRRHMCNAVSTTVVARSGVDRGMRRTASARPITARRPLHRNTDSGGTEDLRREGRHPTGTGRRLLAAGTGRRPPVAGIPIGTGRHATSVWRSATLGRSITAATAPHRSSTRCSVAGASGSSVPGSRCTDLSSA
jgi:hypothetical protein